MFYKRNQEKELCSELFQNPTSEYRGTPFWAWNCTLDNEMLDEQIGYMKEMGFGGFHERSEIPRPLPLPDPGPVFRRRWESPWRHCCCYPQRKRDAAGLL